MAEFCRQCAEGHFPDSPEFWNDLAGITTKGDWKRGYANVVICEGCGVIQVDPEGNCATDNCLEHGHKPGMTHYSVPHKKYENS